MELENSCSNLAQILTTVGRNSADFRSYLSFVGGEEVNVRSILANFDGYESPVGKSDHGADFISSSSDESGSGAISDNQPRTKLRTENPWVGYTLGYLFRGPITLGFISKWYP